MKQQAKQFNNFVGSRVRLTFNTPYFQEVVVKDNNVKIIDDFNIELTSHGVSLLDGSVAKGLTNEEIEKLPVEEWGKMILGDCDYSYNVSDIEKVSYVREAEPNEMGALQILTKQRNKLNRKIATLKKANLTN